MRTFLLATASALAVLGIGGCGGDSEQSTQGASPAHARTAGGEARTPEPREPTATAPPNSTAAEQPAASGDSQGDGGQSRASNSATHGDTEAGVAVMAFFDALATGNGAKACSLLADSVQQQLLKSLSQAPRLKGKACPELLSTVSKGYAPNIRQGLAGIRVLRAQARDGLTLVTYQGTTIPKSTIPVTREPDGWKLGAIAGGTASP